MLSDTVKKCKDRTKCSGRTSDSRIKENNNKSHKRRCETTKPLVPLGIKNGNIRLEQRIDGEKLSMAVVSVIRIVTDCVIAIDDQNLQPSEKKKKCIRQKN